MYKYLCTKYNIMFCYFFQSNDYERTVTTKPRPNKVIYGYRVEKYHFLVCEYYFVLQLSML